MINAVKVITKRECEWIDIKENCLESLTEKEYAILAAYLKKYYNNRNVLKYDFKKIMFVNYVGYIQFSDFAIEILPKISLSKTGPSDEDKTDRRALMEMLYHAGYIKVDIFENVDVLNVNISLLDVFASLYADLVYAEIRRGFYHDYISVEENRNTLKGKVIVKGQINNIYRNSPNAYCKFDEFSHDNNLNKIFKAAFKILRIFVKNAEIKKKLNDCSNFFDEVDDGGFNPSIINTIVFDRRNERFKTAFILAGAILKNLSYANKYERCDGFSFLFEMNDLFEKYVAAIVGNLFVNGEIESYKIQDRSVYLLKNLFNGDLEINLRPDILIFKDSGAYMIIDTKWKSPLDNKNTLKALSSDLYQMYAYVTRYSEAKKCILLYPFMETDESLTTWEAGHNKIIELRMIALDTFERSICDVKTIVQSIK
ncbi:MAG: hypothetical protein A2008_02815 [Candidatus Wallbacteria bacterium GWC2_49_35]|uniref:Restriction endonuclease n=1 Tax=Candidatus Wallbacteria bacterium GWC2_49_35 TaxID=1817813 RepID=A0A1F7WN70_9BACT|nr:MAG: hypothetical protein A2008_02815 [Candidatus Wallbacteria bacterium GWC2_49_35]HBC74839.1 hypothetical protein [Candidatus Wallbacteria bacterium]